MILTELAMPVFAFYLLVACNYTKETFGCQLQHILDQNMIAKHIIGILLLFFLIVVIQPENADREILRNVLLTFGIYLWFLMTTRIPIYMLIVVFVLLLAIYMTSIAQKRYEKENQEDAKQKAQRLQTLFTWIALILSFIGFGIYIIEKRLEYGKDFQWGKFLSGTSKCKGYTPSSAKLI